MSLLPILFTNWWEDFESLRSPFDQYFGRSLIPDDLPISALTPSDTDILVIRPRCRGLQRFRPYQTADYRKSNGISTVHADKNKFQVTLDVQQFNPEEVTIKVVGNNVMVEGKHEEKQDEHGWISRQFVRKYIVPEQCDVDQLKSSLSLDGILSITAPRKKPDPQLKNERSIKIQITGAPALRDDSESFEERKENPSQKNSTEQRSQEQRVKAA